MNHRHPATAAHHAKDDSTASPHWWWLPTVCWVGAIGAVCWLVWSAAAVDDAPSAGTTITEPVVVPILGA